jgi:tRNA(fMet)-specific endonuclease VapC
MAYATSRRRIRCDLNAILSAIEILPLEEPSDQRYGELRADLEKRGLMIGPNDMLIAAHALMLDCVVVTANIREFSRVPNLKVENWLQY